MWLCVTELSVFLWLSLKLPCLLVSEFFLGHRSYFLLPKPRNNGLTHPESQRLSCLVPSEQLQCSGLCVWTKSPKATDAIESNSFTNVIHNYLHLSDCSNSIWNLLTHFYKLTLFSRMCAFLKDVF